MKPTVFCAFVFAGLLAVASRPAAAAAREDSLRCGVNLVHLGDSEEAVLDKCGRPAASVRKTSRWRRRTATFDEWTYDLGPTQFVRVLSFDAASNRLLSIVVLDDYGR